MGGGPKRIPNWANAARMNHNLVVLPNEPHQTTTTDPMKIASHHTLQHFNAHAYVCDNCPLVTKKLQIEYVRWYSASDSKQQTGSKTDHDQSHHFTEVQNKPNQAAKVPTRTRFSLEL